MLAWSLEPAVRSLLPMSHPSPQHGPGSSEIERPNHGRSRRSRSSLHRPLQRLEGYLEPRD